MREHPYIGGQIPEQETYLPECLDEIVSPENPIQFIRLYIMQLDLTRMDFVRSKPRETGRPGYDPAVLLMPYIYGHLNRIRSSRMPERECRRNIELWWLLNKLKPDHNTIADFRKDNRKALKGLLKEFVRLCAEMELVKRSRICADGTPVKAMNSLKQATSIELSEKKLQYAKEQLALVEAYLNDLDETDKIDRGTAEQGVCTGYRPEEAARSQ